MLDIFEGVLGLPKVYYGTLIGVGFWVYYLYEVVKPPLVICSPGPFKDFLDSHVPILKNNFWPTLWCFESRAQTILASILRFTVVSNVRYRREILTLSDGGEVALDWAEENCSTSSPVVIILPGLTGESGAEYIKCLVCAAQSAAIKCVIFNNRGQGGIKLKTPRLYCASKTSEDFGEVLEHVRKTHPHVPIAATGISMGGLILGNYLQLEGGNATEKLKATMIISVPWNIFEANKSMEKPVLNLLLDRYLCNSLVDNFKRHYTEHHLIEEVDRVMKSKTIREFDDHFTSKHFGYKNAEEYYHNATLHNKLHRFEVPTLCLNAADDPFQPIEAIPLKDISESKHVAVIVTNRGGHIGFLEGIWPFRKEQYMNKIFKEFFTAVFTTGQDHPAFL